MQTFLSSKAVKGCSLLNIAKGRKPGGHGSKERKDDPRGPSSERESSDGRCQRIARDVRAEEGVRFPGFPPKENGNYFGGMEKAPSLGHHLLLGSTSLFHLLPWETS